MNVHIETDQYLIRDIEHTDIQGMFELDSDPEVHRYLGNQPIQSLEEAEKVIYFIRSQYEEFGIGRWAIELKESGDFVGWTGLKYEQGLRPDRSYYDLGYRLKRAYWGKGIATETALEALKYGFEQMNLTQICGAADIDNVASNRVLKKVGLQFVEIFEFQGLPINWYTLSKTEWSKQLP